MFAMTLSKLYYLVDIIQFSIIIIFFMILYINCIEESTIGPDGKTAFNPNKEEKVQDKNIVTKKFCLQLDQTLRAKHKTCFLRPDTGPCRADIVQWYYDVKQKKCYRFFWGGCQGNGNRFESKKTCLEYCILAQGTNETRRPHYCSMTYDYGTCFGHYNRWAWDKMTQSCKLHLYSGCGGNQNNFHSLSECTATCVHGPNNTLMKSLRITTCVPLNIDDMN